ncbi:MAG: helix-turn-helix domain-containing protein [Pseudomonadota bacterium]
MAGDFGAELRSWRTRRRLSQLDLGLEAEVSARHISFLETGRARPSRDMVLRLAEHLSVPRAERNRLLTAAGLAPAYGERPLTEPEMAHVRAAVDWMLERHAPYPAFAVDRAWRLVRLNGPAERLFGAVGLGPGDGLAAALAGNPAVRGALENLDEVAAHALARLRLENAHLGGDPELAAAIAALEAALPAAAAGQDGAGLRPAVIPARWRLGEAVLSLFSTLAQFGSAEDVALADLKIELMFPADDASRALLEGLAQAG